MAPIWPWLVDILNDGRRRVSGYFWKCGVGAQKETPFGPPLPASRTERGRNSIGCLAFGRCCLVAQKNHWRREGDRAELSRKQEREREREGAKKKLCLCRVVAPLHFCMQGPCKLPSQDKERRRSETCSLRASHHSLSCINIACPAQCASRVGRVVASESNENATLPEAHTYRYTYRYRLGSTLDNESM
jgi:hypothetical protein